MSSDLAVKPVAVPRIRFARPKMPTGAEIIDYAVSLGHAGALIDIITDVSEMNENTWMTLLYGLMLLLYLFIYKRRWMGFRGFWGWFDKLPPLEGRKERFVAATTMAIVAEIGVIVLFGQDDVIPWITILWIFGLIEWRRPPKETT